MSCPLHILNYTSYIDVEVLYLHRIHVLRPVGSLSPYEKLSRSRKIMFLGSCVRPVRKADDLTALWEQMSRHCGIRNISQSYRPPRPVAGIALLYLHFTFLVIYLNDYANKRITFKYFTWLFFQVQGTRTTDVHLENTNLLSRNIHLNTRNVC
jgi:hypothetical protein